MMIKIESYEKSFVRSVSKLQLVTLSKSDLRLTTQSIACFSRADFAAGGFVSNAVKKW